MGKKKKKLQTEKGPLLNSTTMTKKSLKMSTKVKVETNNNPTMVSKILGGLCLLVFVIIWLCSAGSPFLLGIGLYKKDYKSIWSLLAITIFAYLPWNQQPTLILKRLQL